MSANPEQPAPADDPVPSGTAEPAAAADADDLKRRFQQALAAKQGRRGEDHLDGGRTTGHAHGRIQTKRTFRRKSG